MTISKPLTTPCIGKCSTVFGDSVCRGCQRFVHEVIDWNRYNDDQKHIIWQRLDEYLYIILPQFVRIYDPRKVFVAVERYQLPQRSQNLWRNIYNLIRFKEKYGVNIEECGFSLRDNFSLPVIEQQLHELSTAFYERDFVRAQTFSI